jgi:hypothetical protein
MSVDRTIGPFTIRQHDTGVEVEAAAGAIIITHDEGGNEVRFVVRADGSMEEW